MSTLVTPNSKNPEVRAHALSGGLMLAVNIGLIIGGIAQLIHGTRVTAVQDEVSLLIFSGILCGIAGAVMLVGHFTLQPNEARVLILFGRYHGTIRESGFYWANP